MSQNSWSTIVGLDEAFETDQYFRFPGTDDFQDDSLGPAPVSGESFPCVADAATMISVVDVRGRVAHEVPFGEGFLILKSSEYGLLRADRRRIDRRVVHIPPSDVPMYSYIKGMYDDAANRFGILNKQ
jgi:hypothetical protein